MYGTQTPFVIDKDRSKMFGGPSRRALKVNYNIKAISILDIELDDMFLKAGNVFLLVDTYKKGKGIFVTIATGTNEKHEVGWKIPKGKRIKNRNDLRLFLEKFLFQVIDN